MRKEIFGAGVKPGSPDSLTEIKALICFILSGVGAEMHFMQLYDALSDNGLVNYFDLAQSVEQLCCSGHLARAEDVPGGADRYSVTDLGRQTIDELTETLPWSVRDKAISAAKKVLRRQRRQSEIHVEILPAKDGGFVIELSIPDSGSDLVSFSLFAPTQEECDLIRKRFLNAPMFIYQQVLALLTGNRQVLGEQQLPEEELF